LRRNVNVEPSLVWKKRQIDNEVTHAYGKQAPHTEYVRIFYQSLMKSLYLLTRSRSILCVRGLLLARRESAGLVSGQLLSDERLQVVGWLIPRPEVKPPSQGVRYLCDDLVGFA